MVLLPTLLPAHLVKSLHGRHSRCQTCSEGIGRGNAVSGRSPKNVGSCSYLLSEYGLLQHQRWQVHNPEAIKLEAPNTAVILKCVWMAYNA